jgi:hypothetical protein
MCKPRSTFAERIDAPGARALPRVAQIELAAAGRRTSHWWLPTPAHEGQSR